MNHRFSRLRVVIKRAITEIEGGTTVEYLLLLSLIASGAVAGMRGFALKIDGAYVQLGTTASNAFHGLDGTSGGSGGDGGDHGGGGDGGGDHGGGGERGDHGGKS